MMVYFEVSKGSVLNLKPDSFFMGVKDGNE